MEVEAARLVACGRKSPGAVAPGLSSWGRGTSGIHPMEGHHNARNRRARSPVGRRGQGQGHRPAHDRGRHRLLRPHERGSQRRPHDRGGRPEVRHPPAAERDPDARLHLGDRQRCRGLARGALPRARRDAGARRGDGPVGGQLQRPRDRVVPLHDRQGHGALPGQEQDRYDGPRHRSGVRRQDQPGRHPGRRRLRRGHPEGEGGGRARGQEPPADQGLQPACHQRRGGRRGPARLRRAARADGRGHLAAPQPGARRREDGAVRGRPGHHARRRPRHLPVRHQQQPGLGWGVRRCGRRADADRPHHRRDQGLHDPRGVGPVPHGAVRRRRREAVADRGRGRCLHRPRPALRLVRRGRRPLRRPGQRAHRAVHDQARRPLQLGAGAGLCGLRRRRRRATTRCR